MTQHTPKRMTKEMEDRARGTNCTCDATDCQMNAQMLAELDALRKENARLFLENTGLSETNGMMEEECDQLQAENEKLSFGMQENCKLRQQIERLRTRVGSLEATIKRHIDDISPEARTMLVGDLQEALAQSETHTSESSRTVSNDPALPNPERNIPEREDYPDIVSYLPEPPEDEL